MLINLKEQVIYDNWKVLQAISLQISDSPYGQLAAWALKVDSTSYQLITDDNFMAKSMNSLK